ncbi:sugar ABC transporter permease [Micromonospora sp. CPCC 205539]|uniref:sugar ABC transporter permease n=1 Tax=Micromonospora sp. CPCC 205539 TaxID=3122408 RepID=UPI002FF1AB0E
MTARVLIGLALMLPAVLAWLWSYVLPTVSTVLESFQRDDLIRPAESVGTKNYEHVFDSGTSSIVGQVGFALLLGLVPLALALLAAPLLAVVAHRAGRVARLVTRGVLALPVAGYAPVAILIGLRFDSTRSDDFAKNMEAPGGWLTSVVAQTTFGLVIAVAATLYLSALRRREPGRRSTPAVLAVGGLLVLGILAAALQIYTTPAIMTDGGPQGDTTTPVLGAVQAGLRTAQFGVGAATSTLLLALLGLLGLGAVGLILGTGLRIEFDGWRDRHATEPKQAPAATGTNATQPLFIGLAAVALVAFLGILGWALAPWLRGMFSGGTDLPAEISTSTVLANTWLPPLIAALVSIALAALAGFGIGALRPLGRWSELLLVPFAPWLFVGIGPLAIAGFKRTVDAGQLNTFLGLIPPVWLSVPALFAFTLLFRGQHDRWQAGGGLNRTLILPALPMLAVTFLVTWLFTAQQPLWASFVAQDVRHMPAPLLIRFLSEQTVASGSGPGPLGLALSLPLLVLFVLIFAALQIGYLDRLAIRVGRGTSAGTEG